MQRKDMNCLKGNNFFSLRADPNFLGFRFSWKQPEDLLKKMAPVIKLAQNKYSAPIGLTERWTTLRIIKQACNSIMNIGTEVPERTVQAQLLCSIPIRVSLVRSESAMFANANSP